MNLSQPSRLRGGLFGLLIGDALGVPYEFHSAASIPESSAIEMTPPAHFERAHAGVPPGTWSDDGAQALALLDALLRNRELDLDTFADNLLDWVQRGAFTPDGRVFDVGLQTQRAFEQLRSGVPAANAGPDDERDNGNGSLMRCLPVVLVTTSRDEAIHLARKQSRVTHGHARAQLTCALYCVTALGIVEGLSAADAVRAAEDELLQRYADSPDEAELKIVLDGRFDAPQGSGYVVDSFWSAIHCVLSTRCYEDCVKRAISLGNDTDTTAAIAGGLAGIVYGEDAIPGRWMAALQHKALVDVMLAKI
ncbi:MAG: ADP-ribosylglycohydrolase family protein [Paraburkholderia tropica]|uniref:ADP-ribosylglycohydrolase n=1 Tax=Paraburkholderia tropica TaxID=92647 RepID=A0ABX5MDS2_9BURK|nr:ADP-ribosylglycohydrolase family protein [Paraburkholderia tropica]MBB3005138.1 ADP-ribosylglycohydrolase [Paraburkholderia tropica]MBB6324038.1 ADP-ribosylglycohydrolase [Paraburkholderia tropica]MDE1143893.1 ADP-ribosylglycohydrolase family protein [Paraburkholderia tropica]PXX05248.1 ADP-ribosylglycohydrolase [Paraburkholderia tropica]PZW70567.1 ADP-ribosylglycohydrolase [Paraburkholderia tropica]